MCWEQSRSPTSLPNLGFTNRFQFTVAAWVFFRAETFGDATLILETIAGDLFSTSAYQAALASLSNDRFLRNTVVLLMLFVLWEWVQRREECPLTFRGWPVPMRWSAYSATAWLTLLLMPRTGGQEFIYFAF